MTDIATTTAENATLLKTTRCVWDIHAALNQYADRTICADLLDMLYDYHDQAEADRIAYLVLNTYIGDGDLVYEATGYDADGVMSPAVGVSIGAQFADAEVPEAFQPEWNILRGMVPQGLPVGQLPKYETHQHRMTIDLAKVRLWDFVADIKAVQGKMFGDLQQSMLADGAAKGRMYTRPQVCEEVLDHPATEALDSDAQAKVVEAVMAASNDELEAQVWVAVSNLIVSATESMNLAD